MTSLTEKVEYVRGALTGPTLKHHCHWPGCVDTAREVQAWIDAHPDRGPRQGSML